MLICELLVVGMAWQGEIVLNLQGFSKLNGFVLLPGKEKDIVALKGSGTVNDLEFRLPQVTTPGHFRHIWLRIERDGELSVSAPIGDFFGCFGEVQPSNNRLYEVDRNSRMRLKQLLDYGKSLRVSVLNRMGSQSTFFAGYSFTEGPVGLEPPLRAQFNFGIGLPKLPVSIPKGGWLAGVNLWADQTFVPNMTADLDARNAVGRLSYSKVGHFFEFGAGEGAAFSDQFSWRADTQTARWSSVTFWYGQATPDAKLPPMRAIDVK